MLPKSETPATKFKTLWELKIEHVVIVLSYYEGNKSYAAKALGVSLRTLRYWVAWYDELKEFKK